MSQAHPPRYTSIYSQVQVPVSSPDCLIFPYDSKTKMFQIYSYTIHQTHGRLTHQELDTFLEQVNVSIKKWHEENKLFYDPPCAFWLILAICIIFFPLVFVFACYMNSPQKNVLRDLDKSINIANYVILMNHPPFMERGLRWVAPNCFPHWIEFETNVQEPRRRRQNGRIDQGVLVNVPPPEIHTVQLTQQDYQPVEMPNQQNFYSPMNQHPPMTENQFNFNICNENIYNK